MNICLIGNFSGNLDEGMKVVAQCLAQELVKTHHVLKVNMYKVIGFDVWRKLNEFHPDVLHYVSGHSPLSFIILRALLLSACMPFLSKYPDVVFKLKDDWGVGWETDCTLFGRSFTHKLFSGNHRQESAVFLLDHPDGLSSEVNNLTLTDVAPTILDLLEIEDTNLYRTFDGKSILARTVNKKR
jgi:hypothetical protein